MKHENWLKKLGLKEINIHMGLFDYTIICIVGKYESMNEYIQMKFDDKDFDLYEWDKGFEPRGKCFYRAGFVPVIWIPRYPKTPREHASLAHECLHSIYHLFDRDWETFVS